MARVFCLFADRQLGDETQLEHRKSLIGAAIGAATTHWSGIMLTMLALTAVARVSRQAGLIVYPITNGLVIPVGVILGALILKQKFSLRSKIGVALGMAAMALLSMPVKKNVEAKPAKLAVRRVRCRAVQPPGEGECVPSQR